MGIGGISASQLFILTTFFAIYFLILVVPFWQIFKKAGFSAWLSLLMLIPLVNLCMLYFLGFAQWPSLRRKGEPEMK